MKKMLFCCALLCCTQLFFAQTILTGTVVDARSGEPLGYVSIGIPGTDIGTVSAPDGVFRLEIPEGHAADSAVFSLLGYAPKRAPLAAPALRSVVLEPAAIPLREVVVRPDLTERRIIGKQKMKAAMVVNFALNGRVNQNLGSEIGRLFKIKKTARLERFHFYVAANDFDTVRFRVNVYAVRRGRPGENLLKDQVLASVYDKKTGWVSVDLNPAGIFADESVIVAVEWVYAAGQGTELSLPIAMPAAGSRHYYKYGSKNHWKRFEMMSAAMALEVRE